MEHSSIAEKDLYVRLSHLFSEYRRLLGYFTYGTTPQAIVFEFQHALAHFSYYLRHVSPAPRKQHLNSVHGHLERGIIDAYKHIVFDAEKFAQWSIYNTECMKAVIRARVHEFYDVDKTAGNELCIRGAEYEALCRTHSLMTATVPLQPSVTIPLRGNVKKEFFVLFTEWAQLELVYSALHGKKNANSAEAVITTFFTWDCDALKKNIEILQIEIIHETLVNEQHTKAFFEHDPHNMYLVQSIAPTLKAYTHTQVHGGKTTVYHAAILPLYPKIQAFWGYKIKPFVDIA